MKIHDSTENNGNQDTITNSLLAQGDHDGALKRYRIRLEISEAGASQAIVHNLIGRSLSAKGEWKEARDHCHRAIAIFRDVWEPQSTFIAALHSHIGWTLDRKGDYDAALVEFYKGLEMQLAVEGRNFLNTATMYSNIAETLFRKGDADGGIRNTRHAFDITNEIFGPTHPIPLFYAEHIKIWEEYQRECKQSPKKNCLWAYSWRVLQCKEVLAFVRCYARDNPLTLRSKFDTSSVKKGYLRLIEVRA
jgi:tetratricopeptide (TPR) repeat protein